MNNSSSKVGPFARLIFHLSSFIFILALASPSHAASLRLVKSTDTALDPGTLDDTVAVGDTFFVEMWLDATDTFVNGFDVTMQYDGTQLQLLASSDAADSFTTDTPGLHSDEIHDTFGDILYNTGFYNASASDTVRYAALSNADSVRYDARIARFQFLVRTTATLNTNTAITFLFTANDTTVITFADTNPRNVLTASDTGLIRVIAGNDTHAVLSLVSPGSTNLSSEFISIYNPTSAAIDLSTYYISDADTYYSRVPSAETVGFPGTDFIVKFPAGATLASGETVTVALSSTQFHTDFPGVRVDYEVEQDGFADGVTDMTPRSAVGSSSLINSAEVMVLFYWDGSSDLVRDVDIFAWGTPPPATPDKTGVSIDGPDGGVGTSTYFLDDTSMTRPATLGAKQVYRRGTFIYGDTGTNEAKSGGNGLYGHDETTESCSVSFALTSDSVAWHRMLIAFKTGNIAASIAEANETQVEALSIHVRGARSNTDSLVQLDVTSLGVADTGNIDTVSLWIDADNDSVIGASDTLVGNLTATGARAWRFTGSVAIPAATGRNLLLGFAVGATVQNGETVQFSIAANGMLASTSDSGSFVALTNTNTVTLTAGVLKVAKLAEAPSRIVRPGDSGVTVLAVRITGAGGADTLTNFAVDNLGSLDDTDVNLFLWRDADGSFTYTAGDTLVGELPYVTATGRWETNTVAIPLASGGDSFVFTISLAAISASEADTFHATVPASSCDGVTAETGPALTVTNTNQQTLGYAAGIANHVVIAAIEVDAITNDGSGEWILLYNPTDTPVSIQNWKLRDDDGSLEANFYDTTIPARGWYLVADAAWVKDNAAWPPADSFTGLSFTNGGDGVLLVDSTGATIDRFGWGTAPAGYESAPATAPGAGEIYVRKAHILTAKTDIFTDGRDTVGGAGFDSFDNTTDFVLVANSESGMWALRNRWSATETPALKTTVVKIFSNAASTVGSQSETGVVAGIFFVQGDTSAAGTITNFRVEATDTIADTNLKRVDLYRDVNADGLLDGGDAFVAQLTGNGTAVWETSGIAAAFNALTGETFFVVLSIADTVTDGETFQCRIAVRTCKAGGAESGPTATRTNSGVVTLDNISPLQIVKGPNMSQDTVVATKDTITVIAFRFIGNSGGDTIRQLAIQNTGTLTTADIAQVRLWRDANGDSVWSTGDTFVTTMVATAVNLWMDTTSLATVATGGSQFLITIDLGTATELETFAARIPPDSCLATVADTGPTAAVTEPGIVHVLSAIGVTAKITEVNIVSGTADFIEVLVLNDGNGGAGVNMRGWYIAEPNGGDSKIVGNVNNVLPTDSDVTVRTGERIVFIDAAGTDSVAASNGAVNAYNSALAFSPSDDVYILYDNANVPRDAVVYSNRDGAPINALAPAAAIAIAAGQWAGGAGLPDSTQSNAVGPRTGTSFTSGMSLQRGGTTDRDTYLDWGEAALTQGQADAMESPPVPPARISGCTVADLPNDLGGVLRITWNADTSNADFLEYRIYLETSPLSTLLDSNLAPDSRVSDSSVSAVQITGLTNGESYYAVVTAVDSYGLEFRFALNPAGPAAPIRNVTGTPVIRFSEVKFSGTGTEFIELRVVNDGNASGGLNMSGYKLTNDTDGADETSDLFSYTFGSTTVSDSEFVVIWNIAGTTESDSGGDSVVNIYNQSFGFVETDEGLYLLENGDTITDFVFWSNRDGVFSTGEDIDLQYAIDRGAWAPLGARQNNARNPLELADFDNAASITRDRNLTDNNSDTDWAMDTTSAGAAPTMAEAPFAPPAYVQATNAADVPNDGGGAIRLTWTPVVASDLRHYNIYRYAGVIPSSLYTTDSAVVDTVPLTDSAKTISGLISGDTYYFAVTAVDSYGNERKDSLVVDSAMPVVNVSGETILVAEVSPKEISTGVQGYDWIELIVVNDGNAGGPLDMNGWRIVTRDGTKTLGSLNAHSGDRLLVHATTGTDEADSMAGNADGVIDLYSLNALTGTDNHVSLFKVSGDTADFVTWVDANGYSNAGETNAVINAIAAGHWQDTTPAGVGAEDGLNSDSISTNFSIIRSTDTADGNTKGDWTVDSSPTPGSRNDTGTLWRLTGTLDLLGRASEAGVTVLLGNGTETFYAVSTTPGSYVIRVRNGTYDLIADTNRYLRESVPAVVISNVSIINQNIGSMVPGDANDDNYIDVLDASITKHALDKGTGNAAADHVDPVGVIDTSDLQAVRDYFGRVGD